MKSHSYLQRFGEVELAVSRRGRGMPFVWGHALMGSMKVDDLSGLWSWDTVERSAEVVRYDARGHGNSDGSYDSNDYCWDRMAEDMLAVANSIAETSGSERYILGGISMGCATAIEAAVQNPDRVAGLVLVLPPTAWETRPRQSGIYRRLAWVSGLFGAIPYRLLDLLPIPMRQDGRNQLSLHTMRGLANANPLHVQAALGGAARSDMADPAELARLQIPTLILAWEDDPSHPESTATALAETLPDVRDIVICHPAELDEWEPALTKFLGDIASSQSGKRARKQTKPSTAGRKKSKAAA